MAMKGDCVKSLELLSDYRDGALDETAKSFVRFHLADCPPCDGIFKDLDLIVLTAPSLVSENGVAYPDETVVWQRMAIVKPPVH